MSQCPAQLHTDDNTGKADYCFFLNVQFNQLFKEVLWLFVEQEFLQLRATLDSYRAFYASLQTKTMCKGRSYMLSRLMGNCSQMSLGREAGPFVSSWVFSNFSIFETYVHASLSTIRYPSTKDEKSFIFSSIFFPHWNEYRASYQQYLSLADREYVLTVTDDHARLLVVALFSLSLSPALCHINPPFTSTVTPHSVSDCCCNCHRKITAGTTGWYEQNNNRKHTFNTA